MPTTSAVSLHSKITSAKRAVDHARQLQNVELTKAAIDRMNELLDQLTKAPDSGRVTGVPDHGQPDAHPDRTRTEPDPRDPTGG